MTNKKFEYDFYITNYDNIMKYAKNKDYWDENDKTIFESLKIDNPMVGINRKKWNYFFNHIKLKLKSF
jgi:hypothetical protein